MHIPDTTRHWIYGIFVSVIPLLVAYGLISATDAPLWLALGAAVLYVVPAGTALTNFVRTDRGAVDAGVGIFDEPIEGDEDA